MKTKNYASPLFLVLCCLSSCEKRNERAVENFQKDLRGIEGIFSVEATSYLSKIYLGHRTKYVNSLNEAGYSGIAVYYSMKGGDIEEFKDKIGYSKVEEFNIDHEITNQEGPIAISQEGNIPHPVSNELFETIGKSEIKWMMVLDSKVGQYVNDGVVSYKDDVPIKSDGYVRGFGFSKDKEMAIFFLLIY